jgi:hypothetical protein
MTFLLKIIGAAVGGFISRLCGRKSVIPFGLEQWLYAMPYGIILLGSWWAIPAYFAAVLGKRTGHGQYIGLGYGQRQLFSNDEALDPIVRFFFGLDRGGDYWRCAAGLGVTGMAVTILPGLLYGIFVNPLGGAVIAFSGASKAIAYMIGWKLYEKNLVPKPTVVGEILTGVFGWGVVAWVL